MMGCCGLESQKIRNKDGKINEKKLELLRESLAEKASNAEKYCQTLGRIKECSCPCHVDGMTVLC